MKKLIVIVFIIFGAFLTFSLYRTFAYDTSVVEEVPSTTDLEYTFKIGNSSIKQITVDSGETKYYDIVLGNPNNAKISYSVYYEMVSPSTKLDDYKIEYTSKSTGNSTGIVNNNGNITLNIVVTNTSSNAVTVKVGTVAGYVKGGELALNSGQVVIPKKVTASDYIMSLDDGTTGDSGSGVYKIHHDAIPADSSATGNEIKQTTDYRYYGASPNNYVCLDMDGGSTCPDKHLYRIIGSIYEENSGTNILKVIKSTYLTDGTTSHFSWDTDDEDSTLATPILYTKLLAADYLLVPCSSIWSADNFGVNNGSTLMKLLNNVWLQNSMAYYYNNAFALSPDGLTKKISIDFKTIGLSDNAKNCINKNSMYYLGLHTASDVYVNDIYLKEHSNVTLDGGAKYWNGTVGLMYASDYGYAAGQKCVTEENIKSGTYSCNSNNWLSSTNTIWTMSPSSTDEVWTINRLMLTSGYNTYLWSMYASGNKYKYNGDLLGVVHPVFYLDKDVSITSGTGTSSDPYIISK